MSPAGDLVGGIVPHAGWVYSGRLAANVIRVLSERSRADTIILFGGHLGRGMKPVIMAGGEWETPLGNIAVDAELAVPLLAAFRFIEQSPEDHDEDNTIELQLPFIKHYFPAAKVVAIGAPPEDVSFSIAEALVKAAGALGRRIIAVGSTDMTHYGPNYGMTSNGVGAEAVRWVKDVNDKKAVELMTALDAAGVREEALRRHNACCMGAASTAVHLAKLLGATKGELLDYYTSYDVSPNASFVGYAGIVFG
jgi:AmmeMemoRadiSam system protein B